MYRVSCIVYHVSCIMYHVLYILCIMYYVLCIMYYVLYIIHTPMRLSSGGGGVFLGKIFQFKMRKLVFGRFIIGWVY